MPDPESAIRNRKSESRRPGLNRRPAVYETAALPTELRRRERGEHCIHGRLTQAHWFSRFAA